MWLEDFGQFFNNFSAPLQLFKFPFSWLTLCDLCGHFEYNKAIFNDNLFLGPSLGQGILAVNVLRVPDHV